MTRITSAIVFSAWALFMALTASAAFAAWDVDSMNIQIDQTSVVVNEGCSGTLIDLDERDVLTAAHCVKAQFEQVTVEDIADDGTITKREVRRQVPGFVKQLLFVDSVEVRQVQYRTKLLAVDKRRDLALVQIISDNIAAIRSQPTPVLANQLIVGISILLMILAVAMLVEAALALIARNKGTNDPNLPSVATVPA